MNPGPVESRRGESGAVLSVAGEDVAAGARVALQTTDGDIIGTLYPDAMGRPVLCIVIVTATGRVQSNLTLPWRGALATILPAAPAAVPEAAG